MCTRTNDRARPSSPGPARRAIASRDADAARDPSTTPRDPSPAPRVASPTRRRIRARRIRARRAGAWNPSVARVSRAIRATRARFAIRDRPTGRLSRVEARARRGTRRGRGRASSCAASRASRHASRSRRPTATDRPRVLTVYAYETVAPRRVISLFAHTRWPPARSDDTRHPLDARAATAVDDDDDDDDARAARAGVRDRRRDGGVESARARDARTHRTTRADARGDSDPHRVLRKVKLHASGEDVHR